MSKNSFPSATPHKQRPAELVVSIEKKDTRDTCPSLQHLCSLKAPSICGFTEENGPKAIALTLTFSTPEEAADAKKRLKNLEVRVSSKDKEYTRKISVESAKPKKHDPDSVPALPEFDVSKLTFARPPIPERLRDEPPAWLLDPVIFSPELFRLSGGGISLREPFANTRPARCYKRPSVTADYRIAHPDHPGIVKKCVDMCLKGSGFEHGWTCFCTVEIPVSILKNPEFWRRDL
jgi:hypothetical protein